MWHLVLTPSRMTYTSPKSTSASAPGAWSCGTIASTRRPASRSICVRLTRT